MDTKKCQALKAELSRMPEPQCVPINRFFDGNDDLGSIGCNLDDHPGILFFRDTLEGLLLLPDVDGVWAQISELDPGEDSWPFVDTVVVAGKISVKELGALVSKLLPDEVSEGSNFQIAPDIKNNFSQLKVLWWD